MREFSGGKLKQKGFFHSAGGHNFVTYVDKLCDHLAGLFKQISKFFVNLSFFQDLYLVRFGGEKFV
jgi:hypothetical protein